MSDAQADRLAGIEAGAQVNRTFAAIATGLNALAGAARVSFNSLRDAPVQRTFAQIATGLNALTGNARISYASLRDIPAAAGQRTFAQIATGLNALAGAARVSYNSLKDVPAAVTSLAWSAITGKPATATRWPTYGEVTGTKPPADAEANPDVVPKAEAEAGAATTERTWTAQRVGQAIAALAPQVTSLAWTAITGRPTLMPKDEAEAGEAVTERTVSALRIKQAIDALAGSSATGSRAELEALLGLPSAADRVAADPFHVLVLNPRKDGYILYNAGIGPVLFGQLDSGNTEFSSPTWTEHAQTPNAWGTAYALYRGVRWRVHDLSDSWGTTDYGPGGVPRPTWAAISEADSWGTAEATMSRTTWSED